MSYIDKLLEGVEVEWKPLGEVCILSRGRVMSKEYLAEFAGEYPVYSSQTANNGEIGKIRTFDYDGEFITWTTDGANAGTVFHRKGKFSITNVCGLIKIKDNSELIYGFLFYWLSIEAKKYVYSGMGNPKLMSNQITKIPIPIPPLEIQQKIVAILDTFTELTAELTARKSQYTYYREKLLSFDENKVQHLPLGLIGELVRGNGLPKTDFTETGVPAIHYGQIYTYYRTYTTYTKSFVSPETATRLKKVEFGDVIITNTSENLEDVGKAVVYLGKETAVTGGHATIFKPSNNITGKFFAYYTQTDMFAKKKAKYAKGTKVIDVSANDLAKIIFPVPPIEEQERIVSILDKFDTLTTSITEGLPKEIELRKKQYEYYRDMLLSFPKN